MPIPKNRGKVLKTRTVTVPGTGGKEYMHCEVMSKPGPRGGRTVCGPKRTRKAKR